MLHPLLGKPNESAIAMVTLAVRNLVAKSKLIRSTYIYDPHSKEGAKFWHDLSLQTVASAMISHCIENSRPS